MANLTVNTKKYGQIILNTKPHSDPLLFQNARMSRTCTLNMWNKWILLMVSCVQSLSANFVSAYFRITTWPPQKKNQVLLASNTSQPNLLCFGFDLTQSQSSKPISRNGYGPNCSPLLSLRTSLRCIEGVFEAPSTKFMCIIYVYYLCVLFMCIIYV